MIDVARYCSKHLLINIGNILCIVKNCGADFPPISTDDVLYRAIVHLFVELEKQRTCIKVNACNKEQMREQSVQLELYPFGMAK